MLLEIILGTLIASVVAGVYKIKTMKPVDIAALYFQLMIKSGFFVFMNKTGLVKYMRPKVTEVTCPNGFKLQAPSPFFTVTLKDVEELKIRDDDVFIATYPKTGTTWAQEIVWLVCNNADIKAAKESLLFVRTSFLESLDIPGIGKGIQSLEKWPKNDQRVIKTHLPWELLPRDLKSDRKGKIIVVLRNPKDTCVSYYHFHIMNTGMPAPGTWEEFLTNFSRGTIGFGSFFQHALKYWEEHQKDKEFIHVVTYEAMKKDLRSEVSKIAKFLGKELSDEQIDAIAQHCTFDSMSKNKHANYSHVEKFGLDFKKNKFMRKGEVGDWKNHFTINQNEAFDELYREKMEGTGLDLQFEI